MSKPIGYYQDQYGMHPIFPPGDHNHDGLYLGISAKAADSDKLDNHDSTYFSISTHNHTGVYLPIAGKAADSDKLDNHDTAYFATAGHNHTGVYLPIAGKAADSEKVDGINGASLLRSDADDNVSAHTEWQDNCHVRFGNEADFRMYHTGAAMYMCGYLHGAPLYIQGENAAGTNRAMIYADPDNAVTLHYAGSAKLATSSTGVAITGTLTVSTTTKVTNLNADLLDGVHAASFVRDTGNETIGGIKTFSSFPVTPSSPPGSNYQVANKKYVDDNTGGVGDGTITQAKLKTSMGSVSHDNTAIVAKLLPGGEYGFWPTTKVSDAAYAGHVGVGEAYTTGKVTWTTYANYCVLKMSSSNRTVYCQQRYVTSSGEVHWVFVLRAKVAYSLPESEEIIEEGHILSIWEAPDHPCFGNGGDSVLMPHPHGDFDPALHELIVINPDAGQIQKIYQAIIAPNGLLDPRKDFINEIWNQYEIADSVETPWYDEPVTIGIPFHCHPLPPVGSVMQIVKEPIIKPTYARHYDLRKKNERQSI